MRLCIPSYSGLILHNTSLDGGGGRSHSLRISLRQSTKEHAPRLPKDILIRVIIEQLPNLVPRLLGTLAWEGG